MLCCGDNLSVINNQLEHFPLVTGHNLLERYHLKEFDPERERERERERELMSLKKLKFLIKFFRVIF